MEMYEDLRRRVDCKAEKNELVLLNQDLSKKSDKTDIDMYVMAVSNQKLEVD